MKKGKLRVLDLVLFLLSAVFFLGILTVFPPCGPKEDGSWMTCHWAGQAVTGAAALLLIFSLVHMIVKNHKVKLGLAIAVAPTALLAALIPGRLIQLCMMANMQCRTLMSPAVTAFSAALLVIAGTDIILLGKEK